MTNDATIALQAIFGPVPSVIPHYDETDAVRIAKRLRTRAGRTVISADAERAKDIARHAPPASARMR